MIADREDLDDPRRRLRVALAVIAGVLVLVGGTLIGIVVSSQHHAPQPAASAAGTVGRRATTSTLPGPSSTTAPSSTTPPSTTRAAAPTQAPPTQIAIPSIGVHSKVQVLGLQSDGALQVPQPGPHYDQAAWCDCSPNPGQQGPSVIIGHVDSAASGPSVFFRLGALTPGATVTVTHADGVTDTFRVNGVRRFAKDHFPTELVYGNTPDPQLRLITCGGSFDDATGHYVDDIVVFATLSAPSAT